MGEAKRRGSKEQRVAEGIVKREAERLRQEEAYIALMAARQAAREEQVRRRKEREEENRKWREDMRKAGHPVVCIRKYRTPFDTRMGLSAATMVALAAGSAYGMMPYERRHKPDKGKKGGSCNREVCQKPGAYWRNEGNDKYYCRGCARLINQNAPLCTNEAPDHD